MVLFCRASEEVELFQPTYNKVLNYRFRGLPHIHLCVTFKTEKNNVFAQDDWVPMKMTAEQWIDEYISAEIPDLPADPKDDSEGAQRQREYHGK
jgi:hypothetical protein